MATKHLFLFNLLIVLSIFFTLCRSDDPDCVYTVYVKTSSRVNAGTNSTISLTLSDGNTGIRTSNLVSWGGLLGPGYNYFKRGNLDIFSGSGPCLTGPVCAMNLTSDGTGSAPGWYCDYVEVTSTGVNSECAKQKFKVEQWLSPGNKLTANRDYCSGKKREIHGSDMSVVDVMKGHFGPGRPSLGHLQAFVPLIE